MLRLVLLKNLLIHTLGNLMTKLTFCNTQKNSRDSLVVFFAVLQTFPVYFIGSLLRESTTSKCAEVSGDVASLTLQLSLYYSIQNIFLMI